MKMMKKLILLLSIVFISIPGFCLSLRAEVDRNNIAINESLRLIVTADKTVNDEIDFSQLQHQFDIINTRRSSQTSITNGAISSNTQWLLILAPKEIGTLTIPSFEIKGAYSPALTIKVLEDNSASNNGQKNKELFLEATVDKTSAYVQEQILFKLRLYYKTNLSSYDADNPNIENTVIEEVSENNFHTQLNGQQYNVLEKVYALHPQASGTLTIPSQKWRLEKSIRNFNFGGPSNPYLYTKTKAIEISVKPIPTTSTAKEWLPSTAVTLDENWQQSLLQAKVGEPLNYQLILSANGLSASQLPTIELPNSENFTVYSELPKTENNKSVIGIIGSRTSQFAVIPRTAGQFSFPEISIKWWNTSSDKEETIVIPSQKIIVANPQIAENKQALPTLTQASEASKETTNNSIILWQTATSILAICCCILIFLLFNSPSAILMNRNTALRQGNQTNKNENPAKQAQAFIHTMEQAAAKEDWPTLRQTVLAWGQMTLANHSAASLQDIAERIPDLKNPLLQLDNYLYGNRKDDAFNPAQLLQVIKSIKPPATNNAAQTLKPLYPVNKGLKV
jgi:hypothetical protein